MPEYLVVLSSNDQGAAAAVRQRRVLSALPPRLLVVEADEQVAQELRALPGVGDVISETNSILPDSLNESERLFVQAWQQSQHSDDKQRPGDNLNWDAEGFLPPDHPDPARR